MATVQNPDWTAENRNREQGSTTFKQCGWCKFAGSGTYQYNAMISGGCKLLKSYDGDVQWDTPCRIVKMGKADLLNIIQSKNNAIESAKHSIVIIGKEIEELEALVVKAVKSPPLPDSRSCEHFALNEKVWIYARQQANIPETKWYSGITVNGYRTFDGCVSYVLDELPKSKEGWGCGMSVPTALMDWEFQFFKKNPAKFREWLSLCDKSYNGDRMPMEDIYQSLIATN